jgi:hypothetical protein
MLRSILKKLFGDPYAFRRVDYPGFADHELPKTFSDVDNKSAGTRSRQRRNRRARLEAGIRRTRLTGQ